MSIFENLPIFIFLLAFFVVFVIFLFGGFVMLSAGIDIQKIERGRRILLNSLYALFITLLIAFAFFLVSYLLQRGEVLKPPEVPGEFPPSLAANFPPAPQFIKIDEYYFNGPWSLKENDVIDKAGVYTILCKKNGEYDIIYIGENEEASRLLRHGQYRCWMENCNQELKNLYLAAFWMPMEKYGYAARREFKEELEKQIKPVCPPPVTESNYLNQ